MWTSSLYIEYKNSVVQIHASLSMLNSVKCFVHGELRICRWVFFLWGPVWQMSTISLALREMVCWTFQKIRTFHLKVKRCYWTAGHLYWNYSAADSVFISTRFWGKRSKRALHQAIWSGVVHHTGLWLQLEGFRTTDLDGLMLTASTCCAFQLEKTFPTNQVTHLLYIQMWGLWYTNTLTSLCVRRLKPQLSHTPFMHLITELDDTWSNFRA